MLSQETDSSKFENFINDLVRKEQPGPSQDEIMKGLNNDIDIETSSLEMPETAGKTAK